MLTVAVRDAAGLVRLRFDALPLADLAEPVVEKQFQLIRHNAKLVGTQYYFLVTRDWVRGWRVSDGSRIFEQPAAEIFAPYLRNDLGPMSSVGQHLLAALIQAWISDLWRPVGARDGTPGEGALARSGVLPYIRSGGPAVIGDS